MPDTRPLDLNDHVAKSQFVEKYLSQTTALATNVSNLTAEEAKRSHILLAMSFVPAALIEEPEALRLEFGTRNGHMINFMSSRPMPIVGPQAMPKRALRATVRGPPLYHVPDSAGARLWHGFGNFQGPGESRHLPGVHPNVHLHVGWFNQTLPPFLDSRAGAGPVAFAHLKAGGYMSTVQVLTAFASRCRLRIGSVLAFDEAFGAPRIHREEQRALQEVTARHKMRWKVITYLNHPDTHAGRASIQITDSGPNCRRWLRVGETLFT